MNFAKKKGDFAEPKMINFPLESKVNNSNFIQGVKVGTPSRENLNSELNDNFKRFVGNRTIS